jgi:hypothetical protein
VGPLRSAAASLSFRHPALANPADPTGTADAYRAARPPALDRVAAPAHFPHRYLALVWVEC